MDLFTLAEDGSWDRSFELHRQRGYSVEPVSYTHLDVYKRQIHTKPS